MHQCKVKKQEKNNRGNRADKRQYWFNELKEIVKNNKLGTPEILYNRLIEKITQKNGNSIAMPDKSKVKRKVSSLKAKFRNMAIQSIL